MQVRLIRGEGLQFTVVCTPRRRTGLVPVAIKDLSKEEAKVFVAEIADKEREVMEAIRLARKLAPGP